MTNYDTTTDPGLSTILSGIFHDIQNLFKQQLALFKHEVSADVRRTLTAMISMIVGGGIVFFGGCLLCLMLVYVLHEVVHLPLWGSFGAVGGAMVLIGAALAIYGRSRVRSLNPLPEQSLAALQENLEWTTKPR